MRKRFLKLPLNNADRKLRLNAAPSQISIKVLTPDRKGGGTMNRKWMIGAVLLFGLAISFTFPGPNCTARGDHFKIL